MNTFYTVRFYSTSLLKDLSIPAAIIGIIGATGSFISSFASKRQNIFHSKFKNKSLVTIAFLLSISCIFAGLSGFLSEKHRIFVIISAIMCLVYYFCNGMYMTIIDRYLRNFSNKEIDTKIFATKNLISNSISTIGGLFAAFLLDKTTTINCMIIIGIIYTIIFIIISKFMKTKVGLKPGEYSKEETKYDEQKNI